ncbi:MarR family transcriptional regulator [Actinoplanes sp. NPDC049118]|uniref:MarR family winged helix-turn-helix transcriptional regulator n=1 Tax=Actinoplanes sp. NPDC049118 TaxID=3155769 RepID=UPI0033D3CFF2
MSTELTAGAPSTAARRDGPRRLDRVTALCHTANYARRHLEHTVLRDANLTWTSYDVLHLAVMHRPIDTGALAGIAHVSKGTVTRAATILIKRGLLRRSRPPGDRRRAVLAPTAAGWALNQQIRADLIAELTRLLDTTPGTGTHDLAVLRRLVAAPEPAGAARD